MESIHSAPKDTIRTNSGLYVNVFDTDPETLTIEDIAHALSMIPRFGGHLNRFYSVAQHSVLCFNLAIEYGFEYGLAALLHDASEAYLLDMPTPIKNGLPDYKKVEDRLMRVIAEKFGFEYPLNSILKKVDGNALYIEWENLVENDVLEFECLSHAEAKADFIKAFKFIERTMKQPEII